LGVLPLEMYECPGIEGPLTIEKPRQDQFWRIFFPCSSRKGIYCIGGWLWWIGGRLIQAFSDGVPFSFQFLVYIKPFRDTGAHLPAQSEQHIHRCGEGLPLPVSNFHRAVFWVGNLNILYPQVAIRFWR